MLLELSNGKERGAVNRLPWFVFLVALVGLASCNHAPTSTAITCTNTSSGTSSSSSTDTCTDPVTSISVTISPSAIAINVSTTQPFQDSIQGGTNNVPIWKVNGVTGGNDTVGHIDSNGFYHSPTTIPSPATVSLTVTSFEDQNVFATALITITPAPSVAITSPSGPVTVTAGPANTVTFSAAETGGTSGNILWSVGSVGGSGGSGDPTLGMISASGVYSPPRTPPIGQTVIITAAAQDTPTSTASLPVTISGYSTSSLLGPFAFSLSGSNTAGSSRFFRAGSFVADGVGGLNSVLEDINSGPGSPPGPISATGSYTVDPDGRGTLQFNDGLTPANFNFVLVNGGELQFIGFDRSGTAGTAMGRATEQIPAKFSNNSLTALSGTYVFDFAGVDGSKGLSQIGEFNADGKGNITGGSIDINDGGTVDGGTVDASGAAIPFQIFGSKTTCAAPPSSLSTYSIVASGRGTVTLTTCAGGPTLTLTFYVVSGGSAMFVGTDTVKQVAGFTSLQDPNAPPFDVTALNGNYAFLLTGSAPGGPIATAGSFLADGSGNVTSGVLDENVNGTPALALPFQPSGTQAGTYKLESNGRGTAKFSTTGRNYTLVFYVGAAGTNTTAVFQETDSAITSDGLFTLQQSAPFTVASIEGNYALETSGISGAAIQVSTGQFGANGAGTVTSGELDINTGGTIFSAPGGQPVTGSYSAPAATGRALLTLNSSSPNYAVYVMSPTQAFLLGIQPGQLAAGALLRQF